MYDAGRVIFIGGGQDPGTREPTNVAEIIDLSANPPSWQQTSSMHFRRRQHNATILPDGTVLVTGGTRGGGGISKGFDDLTPGNPVHTAELWDPTTGEWTRLAAEDVDRCYHATAVLLPDATVLSAGGGEYRPDGSPAQNDPKDSHRDAQIFSPPYLFKGPRPDITAAPASVTYGQVFDVETPHLEQIGHVSWIRLPSVTHSFDQNQRINFLEFKAGANALHVTAPASANICPPGHYMLFLLSKAKVPSVAKIVIIKAAVGLAPAARRLALPVVTEAHLSALAKDAAVVAAAKGTRVVVGVTPTCPYGISACWGGAYEALQRLQGVDVVRPIPNAADSTADVFLQHAGLPDLDKWPEQFTRTANGTYLFRGVEISLRGLVEERNGDLLLPGSDQRPPVILAPLQAMDRIQWDHQRGSLRPMENDEQSAYQQLAARRKRMDGEIAVTVTGPLKKTDAGFVLQVRRADEQAAQFHK